MRETRNGRLARRVVSCQTIARLRYLPLALASLFVFAAGQSQAAAPAAVATIEVAPPPSDYATDARALRAAAAEELRTLEATQPSARRVVVSIALAPPTAPPNVVCIVDATLRDARTGVVIATIETTTRASSTSLTPTQRAAFADAAVRRVIQRVPSALVAAK